MCHPMMKNSPFFEFNTELTMFTHTTPSMTSSYLIKEAIYDEELDLYTFDVVSDVGNKYLCILDLEHDIIDFIGDIGESSSWLVRHSIKKLWLEESKPNQLFSLTSFAIDL